MWSEVRAEAGGGASLCCCNHLEVRVQVKVARAGQAELVPHSICLLRMYGIGLGRSTLSASACSGVSVHTNCTKYAHVQGAKSCRMCVCV